MKKTSKNPMNAEVWQEAVGFIQKIRSCDVSLPCDLVAASCCPPWTAGLRCQWSRWWRCSGSIRTSSERRWRCGPPRPPWTPWRPASSWRCWPCPGKGRCRTWGSVVGCGPPAGKKQHGELMCNQHAEKTLTDIWIKILKPCLAFYGQNDQQFLMAHKVKTCLRLTSQKKENHIKQQNLETLLCFAVHFRALAQSFPL